MTEVSEGRGARVRRELTLPLTAEHGARLYVNVPMTAEEWERMVQLIELAKVGCVEASK